MNTSTEQSSGPQPSASQKPSKPWPGFQYQQVPGLANRKISRWLRTQRKNMTKFFYDRGLLDLALRMEQIKASRQGMMAKNRMFQKVLDDYAKLANPGASATPTEQAADQQSEGAASVGVQGDGVPDTGRDDAVAVREDGEVPSGSVPAVAGLDDDAPVIEE